MNCKPGDLAIVSRVTWPNVIPHLGRVVCCIRVVDEDCWITEPELEPGRSVWDGALTPIRPDEVENETLVEAGKPEQVAA